jgi:predicted nucleic acid-binding Zn ribbon protein
MARVRAAFLVGDITSAQVTTDLSQLGIPQAAIMTYLADWYVEAGTPHLHLSAAQVGKLLEDGVLTLEQALTKWVAMGYSPTDAELLLSIYPPPNPNATAP